MIHLFFDRPQPYGPRVFKDGVEITDIFSIELLPLRKCIVRNYKRLDGAVVMVGSDVSEETTLGEYEVGR